MQFQQCMIYVDILRGYRQKVRENSDPAIAIDSENSNSARLYAAGRVTNS